MEITFTIFGYPMLELLVDIGYNNLKKLGVINYFS
jgi:hypothetical protein